MSEKKQYIFLIRLSKEIDSKIDIAKRDTDFTDWNDENPDYGVTMTLNESVAIKKLIEELHNR